jgi:hypothetical protein
MLHGDTPLGLHPYIRRNAGTIAGYSTLALAVVTAFLAAAAFKQAYLGAESDRRYENGDRTCFSI